MTLPTNPQQVEIMNQANPEISKTIIANGIATNFHEQGSGFPLLLIHGSGPGVSAWANWRLVLPKFAATHRVIAPDMVGFGFTEVPDGIKYSLDNWVNHAVGLLDALNIDQTDLIGNSFGGAIALALAIRHPHRVRRIIMMGSVGTSFPLTPGLDAAWGYKPSLQAMRQLLDIFAYDRSLVTDELAQLRYQASIRPGCWESFAAMFPEPRQQGIEDLASPEADIRALPHPALLIHGRDDLVIPLSASLTLHSWIKNSQLHVFGCCGHWVQIEQTDRFVQLVENFLSEA